MQKVILASESLRRRELLSSLGLNYVTCTSKVEEIIDPSLPLEDALQKIAYQKAEAVLKQYPDDIVIGADTVVVLDDQIFGKPKDNEEAKAMLQTLSGKQHRVISAVAILNKHKQEVFYEETKVWFYDLEEEMIDWYISTKEPRDKAGSYGIQGKGCILVKRIEGDYYNVVGLPLASLCRKLDTFK